MNTNTKYEIIEIDNKEVTFDVSNLASSKSLYINATEVAKQFDKKPAYWLKTAEAKEYIEAVSRVANIPHEELVEVKQGGKHQGTWIHNRLAIRFAQWLNSTFAVMCDEKIKEMLEGNPQPVVSEHTLTQILHSNQETTMAIVQLGKNMETMFKTMLDTNNNMVRLKSEVRESLGNMDKKLEQVENRTKITAEISVRTDKVLGKTYNFLRYQPMTKKERKAINLAVEKRAKEIAPYHNMTLENTIASIYRALNKQYNVTTYNDLEHKDILSALDWIEFCELGNWEGNSTLKDPLDDVYTDHQKTNARDIDGNRIYDFDDKG